MKNNIKEYDWGGISFIPNLLGDKIDGKPKAEMWLGAHKTFSSKILYKNEYVFLSDFLEDHKELLGRNDEFPFYLRYCLQTSLYLFKFIPLKILP